ncbi:hypothetical protein Ahy_A04g018504 [Arachis hypogaea]|uniref:Uncharacterized protein n=1 Tax=Arachis hypogaea TaxID=3818 RepID=A0A445DDT0_ARAHY|nr:hypothetical protein Ahy_A04g018504 [Arachis hypogaea]
MNLGPSQAHVSGADATILCQYMRCYIFLLIKGYLMTDKSNNQAHIKWLPLLDDFAKCCVLLRYEFVTNPKLHTIVCVIIVCTHIGNGDISCIVSKSIV